MWRLSCGEIERETGIEDIKEERCTIQKLFVQVVHCTVNNCRYKWETSANSTVNHTMEWCNYSIDYAACCEDSDICQVKE